MRPPAAAQTRRRQCDPPMKLTVRINDEEVQRALENGEIEEGSRSEAVRKAISEAYADRSGSEIGETQREALEMLREMTGKSGRIELKGARTAVANRLNIPKETVKNTVFQPLQREGKITVRSRLHAVIIEVNENV